MSPEYLVINCLFWDGTSDYNNRIINMAEDYLDRTEEPTVQGSATILFITIKVQALCLK